MTWKILAGLAAFALFCWTCLYTVDRSEFAYLTILGAHAGALDGHRTHNVNDHLHRRRSLPRGDAARGRGSVQYSVSSFQFSVRS